MKSKSFVLSLALFCFSVLTNAQNKTRILHNTLSNACGAKANFTVDTNAGCAPICVNFSDLSSTVTGSIVGWNWSFGDGGTSTNQNPVWCYPVPGNYVVKLVITTSGGCKDSITDSIHAYSSPSAKICAKNIVGYTYVIKDTSKADSSSATWTWWYGDGVGYDTTYSDSATHAYPGPGTYRIWLIVTNKYGCSDSVWDSIIISVAGLRNLSSESAQVKLYPNPATNELHISIKGLTELKNQTLDIFDVAGQRVYSQNTIVYNNETSINVSGLANGVYFVKLPELPGQPPIMFIKE